MTLKEAYTIWSSIPKNQTLAFKSYHAVQRVLMKKYYDIDIEQFTASFALRIFKQSNESQETKTKAASILVYILQWGADNGYCQQPVFNYSIASEEREKETHICPKPLYELAGNKILCDEPLVKVKPEALEKRMKELLGNWQDNKVTNNDKTMKESKEICQLDPKTFKVINTFKSSTEAKNATGACNVCRAARNHSMAAGYYWAFPSEVDGFKPKDRKKAVTTPKKVERKPVTDSQQIPIGMTTDLRTIVTKDITLFSDEELLQEIKRRGWKGTLEIVKHINLTDNL